MKTLKKILVATDFSEHSTFAISRAIDIAKATNAQLFIVHIIEKSFVDIILDEALPGEKSHLIKPKEYAAQLLDEQAVKLAPANLKINKMILTGKYPARIIVKYAKDNKIDMLVIGAHGNLSFHDWFVGTTAEYIAKKISCPVLIIKNKPKHAYKKIMIPVDFSSASKNAVDFSKLILKKAQVCILHVGNQAYEYLLQNESNPNEHIKLRKEIYSLLRKKTETFINKCDYKQFNPSYDIKLGYPALVILHEIKKSKLDLVIMGTEGNSRVQYLWLGRVASHVLTEVEKDILLVPPKQK